MTGMEQSLVPPKNRYSHLALKDDLATWYSTFRAFDRDGGGDVDLKELGLMFRELGEKPTVAEMQRMVELVDFDGSSTIDFEEFCVVMLRQKRSNSMPEWLLSLFVLEEEEEGSLDAAPPPPPVAVILSGDTQERDGPSKLPAADAGLGVTTPVASRPDGSPPLNSESLLSITDLLTNAPTLRWLDVHGYGPLCGPFVATELFKVVERLNKTLLTLNMSYNNIGDGGASAFAKALPHCCLTAIDLSGNGITAAGGLEILAALQPRSGKLLPKLRQLELGSNSTSSDLLASIQGQLLTNNLPRIISEQVSITSALRPATT